MASFLTENWPIISQAILIIVWLIRLEGKVLNSEKRLDVLEDQHQIIEQMALDIREMKTDMKWLLKDKNV